MATAYESSAQSSRQLTNHERRDASAISNVRSRGKKNVGETERQVSLAAGGILALLGLARRDIPGLLIAAVGGGLVYRGTTGHCSMYGALGLSTADDQQKRLGSRSKQGIQVVETFLIDKPPEVLYAYWRKLENLPAIMSHLKSVQVIDERRSHWIAIAPAVVGGFVEWDAEIIEDQPSSRISWRSLPGADVDNRGSIEFARAPGDRGTAVRAKLKYLPPAGQIGHWVAKLFGDNPETLIREDLRNFKRVMEIGEVLTTSGQPRGACIAGVGRLLH